MGAYEVTKILSFGVAAFLPSASSAWSVFARSAAVVCWTLYTSMELSCLEMGISSSTHQFLQPLEVCRCVDHDERVSGRDADEVGVPRHEWSQDPDHRIGIEIFERMDECCDLLFRGGGRAASPCRDSRWPVALASAALTTLKASGLDTMLKP